MVKEMDNNQHQCISITLIDEIIAIFVQKSILKLHESEIKITVEYQGRGVPHIHEMMKMT